MVSLGRELLGGNGILADFLVAKVETPGIVVYAYNIRKSKMHCGHLNLQRCVK